VSHSTVGELGLLLKDQSQLLYEDGDVDGLVAVIKRQLDRRETVDLTIPTWRDQAQLLQQLMQTVLKES
jgi:hypothetical protein